MLAPLNWLNRFTKVDVSPDELRRRMVMSGTGVEGIEKVAPEISGVVVGKVLSVVKHPNADTLFICRIDVGGSVLQICTGAKNVTEGVLVPVATHGATLAEGLKIKTTKMRGEASEGMLCSYQELGMPHAMYPDAPEDGILIFGENYSPGSSVESIFGLDDIVFDFEILANRPDCQSIAGVAREVAATLGNPYTEMDTSVSGRCGDVNEHIRVTVENERLCPRFCGKIIKNVKIAPSPMWMRNALYAAGIRPINNIVDITNYVMLECGQPLHAYDLTDISGAHIIVRNAKKGEIIRTLDGKDRALDETMLVIADESRAVGVAGVMGGENTEIKQDTVTVFIEAASFDTASVRVTSKKLGMHTQACGFFSKGVSPAMVRANIERAAHLIEELGCGQVADGTIDVYPKPAANPVVIADIDYLYKLMGVKVPVEDMTRILASLNIECEVKGNALICKGPEFRSDLSRAADISEEILRMYGYDKLPSELMETVTMAGAINRKQTFMYSLREILGGCGALEAYNFSFISPKAYDMISLPEGDRRRKSARIENPLGEDYSLMRTTLLPSLLATLSLNRARNFPDALFYEIAPVFWPKQIPLTELADEILTLCIGMYGDDVDFYSLKGILELICERNGVFPRYERASEPYLHPGKSANAIIDGKKLAVFGQLHPDVCERYKLPEGTFIAEMDLVVLMEDANYLKEAKPAPRFPAVSRDIALVMDESVLAGDCMETIKAACGALLESVSLFDEYRDAGIGEGRKSLAFTFTLRSADRTLTDEDANKAFAKVLSATISAHGAELRS